MQSEAVKGEMGEGGEVVLPFELDVENDGDLLSLSEEMHHLLHPGVASPLFEIEANASGSFSYSDADDLFDLLMKESLNRVGGMMIFDLVTTAQDYMPSLIERKRVSLERRECEERERRERVELEEAFRDNSKSTGIPSELWDEQTRGSPSGSEGEEGEEEWATAATATRRKPGHGVFQPAQFVGSISNILKKFSEGLQIQRIENILRQDLAERFHHCQQAMTSALAEEERKRPQMYNLKTQVAFHGTLTRSLPSIVEQGLVIPGSGAGNKVKVRCGSSLGVGIYLSPSPQFSLSFTDCNRLLVCAALLGRVYHYGSTKTDKHQSRFNSLVCGDEWVFFNAAQVLPCYVIIVKECASKESHPPPLSSLLDSSQHSLSHTSEENVEQKRARLAARARKFLPYGFGPGSKTVVLDAASVDDDEEDYGDYQLLRSSGCQEDQDLRELGVLKERSILQDYRYTTTPTHSTTDSNT